MGTERILPLYVELGDLKDICELLVIDLASRPPVRRFKFDALSARNCGAVLAQTTRHDTFSNPLKDQGFFGDVAWCLYYSSATQPADGCGRQSSGPPPRGCIDPARDGRRERARCIAVDQIDAALRGASMLNNTDSPVL